MCVCLYAYLYLRLYACVSVCVCVSEVWEAARNIYMYLSPSLVLSALHQLILI